jgi:hypothetical protein
MLKGGGVGASSALKPLSYLLICSGPLWAMPGKAQDRESLAGESAAQALRDSAQAQAEQYNMHYGPVGFQIGAGLHFGYTDNAFYSQTNRLDDFVINPELNLAAFMQVSEINTLKLSVGLGYEYYVKNSVLNQDAPMVNPDSELVFNIFAGNFRIGMHERFSYQETLFINTTPSGQDLLFNFNDVGIFSRWDNLAGFGVDWDLDKLILSASYDHENFVSTTASYNYLKRASELFTASASFLIGDQAKIGLESQAGLHNYESETVLNDHWQARVGPFADMKLPEKVSLRAGGGYDTAQYDAAGAGSDFETYYAYGRISQETRLFTHSLSAGHEHLLGDNANNLETTYVRYSINSPVFEHIDLGVNGSVHFDKEFGGPYLENFTYYVVGFRAGYQLHKYWRADLSYQFMLKNSDLPFRDFYRNRVILGVTFTF